MGEQPTRGGGDDRRVPGRSRSSAEGPDSRPLTVEQLLARQDGPVTGRRRAARRGEAAPGLRAPDAPPAGARDGLPPLRGGGPRPDAERPTATTPPSSRRAGLPPVPGGGARPSQPVPRMPSRPVPPLPSRPVPPLHSSAAAFPAPDVEPGVRPSRPVAPLPPLPGRRPPAPPPPPERQRAGFAHRAARSATATPGRRRTTRVALLVLGLVALVGLYHLGLYFYVDRSIGRVDALATDGPEVLAPQLQADTENYLVVGTGVPGEKGPASVATLIASVSGDEDRAVLVSVPPTAYVDTPVCRASDGELRQATSEPFASSLLDGGPACMVRAVQQLSGLRVDHYLAVDLTRLPEMVDALGGVSMCVPGTAAVAASAKPLPAGRNEVTGAQATGYLDPADPAADVTGAAVAERAQLLLTATLRSAMSTGTLVNTVTLTRFLTRAADALTVDDQTTLGDLRGLAGSLGGLPDGAVQRAGVPVAETGYVPVGSDQPFVLLDAAGTRSLFDSVIKDTEVPEQLQTQDTPAPAEAAPATEAAPPAADPAAPPPLTAAPDTVTVDVLNGTATSGLAGEVADLMRGQGFVVGNVGNDTGTVTQTVVRFGPGVQEQARTVAAAVPGAVLEPSDAIGDTVQLVVGPGYSTVVPVQLAPPAAETPAADTPAATATQTPAAPSCS